MNLTYLINPPLENAVLNELFSSAWGKLYNVDFTAQLNAALCYVCAFDDSKLIGFVKLISDAGVHAFLLDPSVHADYKRRGIGQELVARAVAFAEERGCEWVHVDFDDHLEPFYAKCGFKPTKAGLIALSGETL
jgi:predicted N-acetyltransferase YhbS